MFADSAKIFIKSGKGGDGHVSFRRELFVAAGGPEAVTEEKAETSSLKWMKALTHSPISE